MQAGSTDPFRLKRELGWKVNRKDGMPQLRAKRRMARFVIVPEMVLAKSLITGLS
jgi:hypothetical protein